MRGVQGAVPSVAWYRKVCDVSRTLPRCEGSASEDVVTKLSQHTFSKRKIMSADPRRNPKSVVETQKSLSKNGRLHWQRAITKFALYHSLSVTNEAFQKKANEAWNEFLILFSEQPE